MLDDLNRDVASSGGGWFKLNLIEHGTLKGIVVDVETREKTFEGSVVLSRKTGKPARSVCSRSSPTSATPRSTTTRGSASSAPTRAPTSPSSTPSEAKATAEIGDTLAIKVVRTQTTTSQADYKAQWTKGPGVPDWYQQPQPLVSTPVAEQGDPF